MKAHNQSFLQVASSVRLLSLSSKEDVIAIAIEQCILAYKLQTAFACSSLYHWQRSDSSSLKV
ncbi:MULTISPECIES: hypothetical protein [unclassified Tolypothrix]|uniref:hypothetical protein n=1 Tax=unclassified Tolypothrix TaxID=2649714 RepID=UPI0005EAA3CB|nr:MULTISPECIES: hypothetical protein [unclassified Tolypothrix]BAY90369.1 hypothetical protein NIES3275_23850 [Microchaete diplosiphon NIES-3275]EKE98638.1 hypothetical protein FDUTEX481_03655 [Tolypothrix sp. PCC 7601]MBE9084277.1 hypothetical protein [Tolypothrix sp. LEGE 11397]UYD24547.1 hypothetical protein HGR01_24325 [Tolypothrix sp. PCC 7712]UYD33224.1 hypothetical protein HG267_30345 [Tolypothrix sp. PCC 7601]